MTENRILLGATLAVGGLLTIGSARLMAQDQHEGIIRISDRMPGGGPACETNGGGCPQAGGGCPSSMAGGCPNGFGQGCPSGVYGHCGQGCGSGCMGRCHCTQKVYAFLHWLDPHGPCSVSPDHGWAPPGKMTAWRKPVAYNTFFPNSWTGQPGVEGGYRAPHVYMPTDTSQMGYYYQHVPYWQPNPAMVPPAPNPVQWHQPLAGGNYGVMGAGYIVDSGSSCPAGADSSSEPSPAPALENSPNAPEPPDEIPLPPAPSALDLQKPAGAPELLPTPGQLNAG